MFHVEQYCINSSPSYPQALKIPWNSVKFVNSLIIRIYKFQKFRKFKIQSFPKLFHRMVIIDRNFKRNMVILNIYLDKTLDIGVAHQGNALRKIHFQTGIITVLQRLSWKPIFKLNKNASGICTICAGNFAANSAGNRGQIVRMA